MTTKHTIKEIEEALYQSSGLITQAAESLQVTSRGIRGRINRSPRLQKALAEAREQIVDKAEKSLVDCIDKNEPWAVSLVLKTLGKNRGYVERQEVTGADSGPVQIIIKHEQ